MSKLLIETTGAFMLMDFNSNQEIHADRPTVIPPSAFIDQRMAVGQIKLFYNDLPDVILDQEFGDWWNSMKDADGKVDKELAMQSFRSKIDAYIEEAARLQTDGADEVEQARLKQEEADRLAAEEKARKEGEEKAQKEAAEAERLQAEEQARLQAEEKARKEAEEKAQKDAEAAKIAAKPAVKKGS